ncbi:MAG: CBS domain-containing protein [Acidobacteriia bacterium]|nr:CBS domain-containing protein [Terriglobia bacterium]
MPIGELCIRQTVIASRETSVQDAAKLMREHHVGDLIVTDRANGKRKPIGIVTDRDIVIEVMAQGLDPTRISIEDIMAPELVSAREQDGVWETIEKMRTKGVRRVPVVDAEGTLAGIIAVDDLIELLADELGDLAKVISREQRQEAEARR